jgi:type I restriction enzyme R subunit
MNEAETPAELIDPQLKDFRAKKLTADYVLVYKGIKLAVVETKSDELGVGVTCCPSQYICFSECPTKRIY